MEDFFVDAEESEYLEYPTYHIDITESGSHTLNCSRCNVNKRRVGINLCQSCIDYIEFHEHFEEIEQSEREIAEKKELIERKKEAIVQLKEAIGNLKIFIQDPKFGLQNKELIGRIQQHIKQLRISIRDDKSELQTINKRLFLEEQSIQLSAETVSEDVRKYRAYTDDEKLVVLETHCTIVRPEKSQENVYFGHVTLIITINCVDYKCRYGIKMYNKLPEKLDHEFWRPSENGISHTRCIHDFGNFYRYFPKETTLSDIMINHFRDCYKAFDRSQWSDQIWRKTDKIKDEPAPKLLKRLKELEPNRQESSYMTYINRNLIRMRRKEQEKLETDRLAREQEARDIAIQAAADRANAHAANAEKEARDRANHAANPEKERTADKPKKNKPKKDRDIAIQAADAEKDARDRDRAIQAASDRAIAHAAKAEKDARDRAKHAAKAEKEARDRAKHAANADKPKKTKQKVSGPDPDDELLNLALDLAKTERDAIDSINTILDKLEDRILEIMDIEKELDQKNTEEQKQFILFLITEYTNILKEVNANIEISKTFPNLPESEKNKVYDRLIHFLENVKNRIDLLKTSLEEEENAIKLVKNIIENLKVEVYEEVYEKEKNLAEMDSSTDDDAEALSSLIAKLTQSLEKLNKNIDLIEQGEHGLPGHILHEVYEELFILLEEVDIKKRMYEMIARIKNVIPSLIGDENKLSNIQNKKILRRDLIDSYNGMIELINRDLNIVSTSLSKKHPEFLTTILVKVKETIETRLPNLEQYDKASTSKQTDEEEDYMEIDVE